MTLVNAMDGDWDKYLDEGGAGSNTLCSASTIYLIDTIHLITMKRQKCLH